MRRVLLAVLLLVGCATVQPVAPPPPQLTVDCGVPSTRAQMAEVTPLFSRCVQAETPVDSCVASLQTTWTLEAIACGARTRGMLAWRADAEGTGTPGDAIEAVALRDWIRKQEATNVLRFKY